MHRIFRAGIVAAFLVAANTTSTVPSSAQQVDDTPTSQATAGCEPPIVRLANRFGEVRLRYSDHGPSSGEASWLRSVTR